MDLHFHNHASFIHLQAIRGLWIALQDGIVIIDIDAYFMTQWRY